MSGNTISITFKLDGDGKGFRAIAQDADGLRTIMGATMQQSEQLKTSLINWSAAVQGLQAVTNAVSQLENAMQGLADVYAIQEQAETKLQTVMRQRMNATDEDIQSIKDLASAQQEIGVIGDEIQLAGAQQVATFLTQKSSIETLLPAMNNLIAQQKGLNATESDAVSVANLMGKAMQGQTSALTRVGITFTDAQKEVMQFGDESQRAAMLAQIITDNVGDMNAELAKTDAGKQKQLDNTLGDIKEQIGGLINGALPFVKIAAAILSTASSAAILVTTYKQLNIASVALVAKTKLVSLGMVTLGLRGKSAAAVVRVFSAAMKTGAYSATAFKIALRGLMMATGIGAIIAGVTFLIEKLTDACDDATTSTNKLLDAEERAKAEAERVDQMRQAETSTLENTRAELEKNIVKLKNFNGTKAQEKKLVDEMNNTYGESMGYFSSVADWYNALISNSEAYCRQMVIEARTRMLANQIAQKEQETHDLIYNDDGSKKRYSTTRQVEQYISGYYTPTSSGGGGGPQPQYSQREIPGTSDLDKANAAIAQNTKDVAELRRQLQGVAEEAAQITFSVRGSATRPQGGGGNGPATPEAAKPEWTEDAANLRDISNNITILRDQLQTASIEEAALINQQIAQWEGKADAIRNAGKEVRNIGPVYHENATTAKEMAENVRYLNEQLENATTDEEAVRLNQQKKAWEDLLEARRNAGNEAPVKQLSATASTLKDIESNIEILQDQLQTASVAEAAIINRQIADWQRKADAIRDAGKEVKATFETFRNGWGGIKGVSSGIDGITEALEGNGTAWQKVTGIVDGFIQIYDGIKTIVEIIKLLSTVTTAHTAAKTAEAVAVGASTGAQTAEAVTAEVSAAAMAPVIVANKLATASYMELAAAAYFAAHAYIPFAGFGIASGFVAAAIAMTQAVGAMPFAKGGIVSGPTLALVGEYGGAANNPEVIAPLDKLRNIIKSDSGGVGEVEFKIKGEYLVGIVNKTNRKTRRT